MSDEEFRLLRQYIDKISEEKFSELKLTREDMRKVLEKIRSLKESIDSFVGDEGKLNKLYSSLISAMNTQHRTLGGGIKQAMELITGTKNALSSYSQKIISNQQESKAQLDALLKTVNRLADDIGNVKKALQGIIALTKTIGDNLGSTMESVANIGKKVNSLEGITEELKKLGNTQARITSILQETNTTLSSIKNKSEDIYNTQTEIATKIGLVSKNVDVALSEISNVGSIQTKNGELIESILSKMDTMKVSLENLNERFGRNLEVAESMNKKITTIYSALQKIIIVLEAVKELGRRIDRLEKKLEGIEEFIREKRSEG